MKVQKIARPLMILLLLGSLSVFAQPKPSAFQLEDPELYYAFLRAHTDLDLKIQASGPAAAQLSSATASLYNVAADDLPKLTAEVRKFSLSLADWYGREGAYMNQQRLANKLPDVKTLVGYQRERQRLVMNAHGSIHSALSPTSWTNLHSYINGAFKATLSTANGAGK